MPDEIDLDALRERIDRGAPFEVTPRWAQTLLDELERRRAQAVAA